MLQLLLRIGEGRFDPDPSKTIRKMSGSAAGDFGNIEAGAAACHPPLLPCRRGVHSPCLAPPATDGSWGVLAPPPHARSPSPTHTHGQYSSPTHHLPVLTHQHTTCQSPLPQVYLAQLPRSASLIFEVAPEVDVRRSMVDAHGQRHMQYHDVIRIWVGAWGGCLVPGRMGSALGTRPASARLR